MAIGIKDFIQGKAQNNARVKPGFVGPIQPRKQTPISITSLKAFQQTKAAKPKQTFIEWFDTGLQKIARNIEKTRTPLKKVVSKVFPQPKNEREALKQGLVNIGTKENPRYLDATFGVGSVKNAGKGVVKGLLDKAGQAGKQRGFISTVKEVKTTAPQVASKIKGSFAQITNQETLREARKLIDKNLDEAVRVAKSGGDAKSNAVAQDLIRRFQDSGRYEQAIDLVETVAKRATEQGQAIQALSIYSRLTPEGALRYTQRIIEQASKARKTTLKLKPEAAKQITEQAKKIQGLTGRTKEVETARLVDLMSQQVPATKLQKLSSLQTMAQLLNPKTAIRNIIGNAGFAAVETTKDVLAAGVDTATSLFTGQRTKALPSFGTQAKGFVKGGKLGLEDALQGVDTSAIATQFDLPKQMMFKNKFLRGAQKGLNIELKTPDRAFYQAAYDDSLRQIQKVSKNLTQEQMEEIAHHDALYRTFQDDSALARGFSTIKKGLNRILGNEDFGLGDAILKYPKTPGNLLSRGIAYSPAGFLKAVKEISRPLVGKQFNQKEFVESFSRALTGTSLGVGTGVLLHKLGIITGKAEKDKDIAAIRRETGLGEYRINVSALKRFALSLDASKAKYQNGDRLISYDWFQPQAIALSIGANIDENWSKPGEDKALGAVGALINSVGTGVDTLGEQPLVQGLTRPLRFQESLGESAVGTLKGVPSSFIPTLLNQIRQLTDESSRLTYDPSPVKESLNLVKNKLPIASDTLPERKTVFGEDKPVYHGGANNPFNVLFNPSFTSKANLSPEAKMVLDIFEKSGEAGQAPRVISYTQNVNGENIKLSPIQVTRLQTYVGKTTQQIFSRLAQNENFMQQPDEEKAKYLSGLLSDIGTAGKIITLGHRPQNANKQVKKIINQFSE